MATIVTTTGFTIVWGASTDDNGIDYYDVLINGVSRTTTSDLTATISGLTTNATYNVVIRVYDLDGNHADSSILSVTTGQSLPTVAEVVRIVQVFSPTSIIDNEQTKIKISHSFITLYNSSNTSLSLNNAKLYWKNADQTGWIKANLSGTIGANKYFLIRGLSPTAIASDVVILSDWAIAVPDLDLSVNWAQAVGDKVTWALSQNIFFLASKSGSVLLTDRDIEAGTIPINPTTSLAGYVYMVGIQADEFTASAYEGTVISGNSKNTLWNRKKVSNIYQDTNNNAIDFESLNIGLLTDSTTVTAEIKSSRNG
jgi:hypothetical protein